MTGKRLILHSILLMLLPLVVAGFGISLAGAIALVLLALLWRWMISLSAIVRPARVPELELETISASHFVEKVRWCMDRLGVDYTEKPVGGTLGAFFLGRSVPVLKFRTGIVRSSIGNSAEILRYLWGRYSVELQARAAFLEPTADRLAFEHKIDRCGVDLQIWIYHHILDDKDLTLHAWGRDNPSIPAWQRFSLVLLYPLLRVLIRKSFGITPGRHRKAIEHIDALLTEVETKLGDGRQSILGGNALNFTDFSFTAIMGLWLLPPNYGGGKADSVRVERDRAPAKMREEMDTWSTSFPLTTAFMQNLYASERQLAGL
jgi:glutathione S-transferase